MKQTLASLLISLSVLCSSSAVRAYDVNDRHLTHAVKDNIIQSSVLTLVSERYEDVDGGVHNDGRKGTGVFLCDNETGTRYILTAEHLFPTNRKLPFFISVENVGITSQKRSYKYDLALLTANDKEHVCFNGKIGTDYHVGDVIRYVGFPGDSSIPFYRSGMLMREPDKEHIYHEAHSYRGDSGGLVVAFDFGEPRLIGISRAVIRKFSDETPWAVAVNGKRICEFLEGTTVHDDYCEVKK